MNTARGLARSPCRDRTDDTFGLSAWNQSIESGIAASAGTVMLAGLPSIVAVQLLLSFLNYDIQNVPSHPLGNSVTPTRRD